MTIIQMAILQLEEEKDLEENDNLTEIEKNN